MMEKTKVNEDNFFLLPLARQGKTHPPSPLSKKIFRTSKKTKGTDMQHLITDVQSKNH